MEKTLKILEHVEVGDLVEILFTGNGKYYILQVAEMDNVRIATSHITLLREQVKEGFIVYDEERGFTKIPIIRALYKKDENGNFLRYEAEES